MTRPQRMTPREYGRWLAEQAPPLSDEAIEKAARILATVKPSEGDQPLEEVSAETTPVAGDGT